MVGNDGQINIEENQKRNYAHADGYAEMYE
jgi:hypothetical protein